MINPTPTYNHLPCAAASVMALYANLLLFNKIGGGVVMF